MGLKIPTWIVWDAEVESTDITFAPKLVIAETPEKAKILYVHTVYKNLIDAEASDEDKIEETKQLAEMLIAQEWNEVDLIKED